MIVSHAHEFIFLKTRKTAGTSIEIALSAACGERDVLTPLLPSEDERQRRVSSGRSAQNHLLPIRAYGPRDWARLVVRHRRAEAYNHMHAQRVRAMVGERVWQRYFKFAVSRNPFDVAVSLFHFFGRDGRESLSQFLRSDAFDLVADNFAVYAIGDRVVADRVVRYDSLAEELDEVRRHLGVPQPWELGHSKVTVQAGLQRRLTAFAPDDVEWVMERCAREIAAMGYRFDA